MSSNVERRGSGGPWEELVGYSRVVRAHSLAWVAGCTAVIDGQVVADGDAFTQTVESFGVAGRALKSVGMTLADVVRTRMFIVDRALADDVGRAHAQIFGGIKPAATLVVVAGLIDPRLLVEIEVDAYRATP